MSKLKQALESAKALAKNLKKGNDLSVPAHVADRRFDVCRKCDKFDPTLERCRECGCFMRVKTKLAGMKCPLNKWGEDVEG
jgi:hypothetical protein